MQEVEAMGAVEQGSCLPVTKKDLPQLFRMIRICTIPTEMQRTKLGENLGCSKQYGF